ncbi:MAG: FkbM family methyltransferase [Dissulfurispiraceae bacterium]
MISDSQKQAIILSVEDMLADYSNIGPGERLLLCDALFAFRILLGRMPSYEQEIDNLFSNVTYRQFLSNLLESHEYNGQFGFMPGGHRLMTDVNGFRFWFNSSDREMGALMATASYEQETVKLLRSLIKPGMCCVDVGAQTGYFTCLLSSIVGQRGFVLAFEPMPKSIALLNANVRENRIESRVRLFPVACAEKNGELAVNVASGMAVAASTGTHKVICVALDDVIQEQIIHFCKIDVEGHEPTVIKGMHKLLTRCHPILLTEFNQYWLNQAGSSIPEYAKLLRSYDYNLWNATSTPTPFDENIRYDMLSNFNVIALPQGMHI